jgi:predicted anti-sigma-YlaC factor YlaD
MSWVTSCVGIMLIIAITLHGEIVMADAESRG